MRWLERFVTCFEWLAAALLAVLGTVSVATFTTTLVHSGWSLVTDSRVLLAELDELFILFIIIELFKMTFAYMRGEQVLPVVLEAILIAVARKVVMLDFTAEHASEKAFSLAALILSTAAGAWLIARARGAKA